MKKELNHETLETHEKDKKEALHLVSFEIIRNIFFAFFHIACFVFFFSY